MAPRRPVLRLLGVLLAHVFVLALASAALADVETTTADEKSSVVLTVHYVASTMTSITVSWSDNANESIVTTATPPLYQIKALSLATGVQLISPQLFANQSEYTLPDLAVDAEYEMCVVSTGIARPGCAVFSTIPVVRDDSLIALLIALAVLGCIVLIALIMWRCAIRRAGAAADADTASEDKPDVDDDEKHGANEKSPLLEPGTADTDPASQQPADPAGAQPDASNQDQPQSLYLFLAGHAFK